MLLVWSGGLDSTWMLYRALNDAPRGNTVRTISINHCQVSGVSQDRTARNKITRILNKAGWRFDRIEVDVNVKAFSRDHAINHGIIQPVMWLSHALLHADTGETIQIGYIKGDDALMHWDKMADIKNRCGEMMGKALTLELPLMFTEKYEIVRAVKKDAAWILENIWWCEPPPDTPNIRKPCGKCTSCHKHATALWQEEQGFGKV